MKLDKWREATKPLFPYFHADFLIKRFKSIALICALKSVCLVGGTFVPTKGANVRVIFPDFIKQMEYNKFEANFLINILILIQVQYLD